MTVFCFLFYLETKQLCERCLNFSTERLWKRRNLGKGLKCTDGGDQMVVGPPPSKDPPVPSFPQSTSSSHPGKSQISTENIGQHEAREKAQRALCERDDVNCKCFDYYSGVCPLLGLRRLDVSSNIFEQILQLNSLQDFIPTRPKK